MHLPAAGFLTVDWIIIGVVAIVLALDAMRSGSDRAVAVALALPLTSVMLGALPSAYVVGSIAEQFRGPQAEAALFGAVFILAFLAIYRMLSSFSDFGGTMSGLIAGLAATAIFATTWVSIPGLDALYHFGPQVQLIFGETYRFWWFLVAYFGLAAVRS